jgi:RNA polymerase sigma factor (sigma-70 family)
MALGQSDSVLKPLRVLLEAGSVAGMTDGQLLERFVIQRDAGAEAAFAAVVARHGPMVLGICRHWLGDASADDAFQAVFLVLARRAGSIRQPELLSAWLHGVAVRIARKAHAQSARGRQRAGQEVTMYDAEAAGREPIAEPMRAEEVAAVHEEVDRLPERYRRAVVLCHFEGLTHAEAARRLGCAPGTVSSLLSRARARLHARMSRRGFASGAVLLAVALGERTVAAAVPAALERATVRATVLFASDYMVAGGTSAAAVKLAGEALKAMSLTKLNLVIATGLAFGTFAVTAGGLALSAARAGNTRWHAEATQAQPLEQPSAALPPILPGAVSQPPPWFGKEAPFDIDAFFAVPPPQENAEPRYLDALFEFSSEVAVCFPEGPDRESRKQAVDERSKRFAEIDQALKKRPDSVPAAVIDALLDEYDTGFGKLEWAQQRPRCLFHTAIGVAAPLPHAQTARQVARVASLKIRRELDRGEIDAALRDIARLLRLSRDLRPRGYMITALVATAIDLTVAKEGIVPLLTAPGLTVAHCDRLRVLLAEHEARSPEPYIESLRAEYLSNRVTVHDLVFDQDRLRKEWNRFGNVAGPSIVAEIAEPTMYAMLAPNAPAPPPAAPQPPAKPKTSLKDIADLDATIAKTTPAELAAQVQKLNLLYRQLLDAANASYPEKVQRASKVPPALTTPDLPTRITRGVSDSSFVAFIQSTTRWKAMLRAAQGLAAVRRWQLDHGGELPTSLVTVFGDAGWPRVPVDPYDDQSIRFAVVDGQPTVYCLGNDGKDDGGRIEAIGAPNPGDVLLRLPK